MNSQRYRIIAIGNKSPNMLSEICSNLSDYSCEIENISSLRLGHSFVVVLMIEALLEKEAVKECLKSVVKNYKMQCIISHCTREKYKFVKSDAFIRIRGIHTTGIKSSIITLFTNAGLDIHGLESDIYHKDGKNVFVINIKGQAKDSLESLTEIAEKLQQENLEVTVATDWKLLA